jgi:hypothetical protein
MSNEYSGGETKKKRKKRKMLSTHGGVKPNKILQLPLSPFHFLGIFPGA